MLTPFEQVPRSRVLRDEALDLAGHELPQVVAVHGPLHSPPPYGSPRSLAPDPGVRQPVHRVARKRDGRVRCPREAGDAMAMEGKRTIRIGPAGGHGCAARRPRRSSAVRRATLRRPFGTGPPAGGRTGRGDLVQPGPGRGAGGEAGFLFLRRDPGRYGPRYAARADRQEARPRRYFGELALLTGGPRTASVIAETSLDTIRIHRPAFRKLLRKEPGVALRIMAGLAERIAECERQLPG